MNANFKIVWFEDQDIPELEEDIEKIIKGLRLKPEIKRYKTNRYDLKQIADSDLVIVDFDMDATSYTGVSISNHIRSENIVVDVILYSAQEKRMVKEIQSVNPYLEGIFFAKKGNDFKTKFKQVFSRILKRAESPENLRGMMMEYSSIFDVDIFELIKGLAKKFSIENEVRSFINTELADSRKSRAFTSCIKKAPCKAKTVPCPVKNEICPGKLNTCPTKTETCPARQTCCYTYIIITDLELIKDLDAEEKFKILSHCLKQLSKTNVLNKTYYTVFKNYKQEIIDYRNAFAHAKSADKRIKLRTIDGEKEIAVDDNLFMLIRENIFKYLDLLVSIKINNLN